MLAVAATDVELPGRGAVRLTVSVGVAAYPEDTDTATELFGLADDALYREAKAQAAHLRRRTVQ